MFFDQLPINPEDLRLLRLESTKAERLGKLTAAQLDLIYKQNWFNIWVPQTLGGLQLDLLTGVRLLEALAWLDASLGWTITLCSGANMFAGYMEPEAASEAFANPRVCFAGSGKDSGTAHAQGEGFLVNGHWPYASGAQHATIFTANCQMSNGESASFWFHAREVELVKSWSTMGMKATGSHSFEINDLFVPSNRLFRIDPLHAYREERLFSIPFMSFAIVTLTANLSGMAMRFLELSREWLTPAAENKWETLSQSFQEHRANWLAATQRLWLENTSQEELKRASAQLTFAAQRLITELYMLCGLRAADTSMEVNRLWRDFFTAAQHRLFQDFWLQEL